ncbi:hypothetical protein F5878DRAFT_607704 [Lentinula raphanica]|uniref:Mid2 domain-containing protein n=1 Tax=Lentinula raphanica TaxID=153919 RepID=A0AA38UHY9_9AGAR|nr:hypothetical protein F5878DRAFT_607704 [Lentinula raphanica]
MFILAWLLVYLIFLVQAVMSLDINVINGSANPATVSESVRATWILQDSDSSLLDEFTMVLVNDNSRGVFTEWSTVVKPNGKSTGIIKPVPTATGTHRIALALPSGMSGTSSGHFEVDLEDDSSPFDDNSYTDSDSAHSKTSQSSTSSLSSSSLTTSTSSITSSSSSTQSKYSTITASTSDAESSSSTMSTTTEASSSTLPTSSASQRSSQSSDNVVAIVLSAVFGTILIMLLLAALLLFIRRRRRHSKIPSPLTNQANRWNHSERFHWDSAQRVSGASRYDNSNLFETSKTVPMSVWDAPESWDTPSLAPSDSVSRLLSLKRVRDLRQESVLGTRMRSRLAMGDRMDELIPSEIGHDSDVGPAVVDETKWVHAGGAGIQAA